jgi:hypothetical protein
MTYAVREAAPQDGAYAAVNQAVDSAIAVTEDYERAIVIPVVVVDTPMFRVAYDVDSESLESTAREFLLWSGSNRLTQPTLVVVLARSELSAAAPGLRRSAGELAFRD